jgi:pilus assembly protein CpaE
MANTNPNILLVSTNPELIAATRAALAEADELAPFDQTVTPGTLFSTIELLQPAVILLDFQFQPQPFNLVDQIVNDHPASAVVAVLSEAELGYSDRVVLSGARAFVGYPYPAGKLAVTLKRVLELQARAEARPRRAATPEAPGTRALKMITVFSPKGGAGTTTVAANLSISLHKALKEELLLVDGKHLFGHAALYLNLRSGNSISDLIAHAGNLDPRLVKQAAVKHASGVHVLPSPTEITQAQGIRPEDLFKVIQGLKVAYPYIVVDGGNHLDENTVTYLDASDKILLVLTPDLAAMRDARQFLDIATSLGYPAEKTLLIVNQAGRKADIKRSEIEVILKLVLFGTIPADEDMALASLNEGVPIVLKKPRHPISRAYSKLTKELVKLIKAAGAE